MATEKTTSEGAPAFFVSSDKHQSIVKAQRDFIGAIAERVEKGEPFARTDERKMVAGILRAWAKQIPDTLPRTQDGVARIEPAYAAIHFACLVNGQGRNKTEAIAELAEIYDASPEAVAEAIAKFEAHAMRLVPKQSKASTD